jgi:hypothetical protein
MAIEDDGKKTELAMIHEAEGLKRLTKKLGEAEIDSIDSLICGWRTSPIYAWRTSPLREWGTQILMGTSPLCEWGVHILMGTSSLWAWCTDIRMGTSLICG